MRRKSVYDYRGFIGPDASMEVSLFEYGIAWKKVKKNEYKFIYGIGVKETDNGIQYNRFDYGFMTKKDYLLLLDESWLRLDDILETCGLDREFAVNGFPYFVYDLVQYHGYENIFGSSYTEGFEII